MAPQKSVSELTELIYSKTKILEDGMKGQPGADFSLAFAMPPPTVKMGASLEAARNEIIEAADELKVRLMGPFAYMGSIALPVVRTLTRILQIVRRSSTLTFTLACPYCHPGLPVCIRHCVARPHQARRGHHI
jgi:hypothetical protein